MTVATADLLDLEGGAFVMGSVDPGAVFVEDSGNVTTAERLGTSFVFAGLLPDDFPPTRAVAQAPWWRLVEEAAWRPPRGPGLVAGGGGRAPLQHLAGELR